MALGSPPFRADQASCWHPRGDSNPDPFRSKRTAHPVELRGCGALTGTRTLISGFAGRRLVHLGDKGMSRTTVVVGLMIRHVVLPDIGSPARTRTWILGFKGPLPTIRRPGNGSTGGIRTHIFLVLSQLPLPIGLRCYVLSDQRSMG